MFGDLVSCLICYYCLIVGFATLFPCLFLVRLFEVAVGVLCWYVGLGVYWMTLWTLSGTCLVALICYVIVWCFGIYDDVVFV